MRKLLLLCFVVLLLGTTLMSSCVLSRGGPCQTDGDCEAFNVCFREWCMPKVVRERLLAEIERQKQSDAGPTDQRPDGTTPETTPEITPETKPETTPETSGPCASACKLNTFEDCYPENTAGCPKVGDKYECKQPCVAGQRFCVDLGGQCPEWTTCRNAATPKIEECNNADDDCDGEIDNIAKGIPLRRDCYGGPDGTQGKGICRPGTQTCVGGQWDTCKDDIQPDAKETCNNGKDDNCDGSVDEDCDCTPDAKQDCGNPDKGECKRGKQTCASNGKWGECLGEIKPATEFCDNKDNDCNGQIDENVTQSCYEGPSGTEGKGPCVAGKRECTAGNFGACLGQKLPQTELCNGIDDDCDGEIDEVSPGKKLTQSCYTGPAGTRSVGECKDGVATCDSGKWGACVGEVTPTTDGCDGVDKDCDGTTDEGCVCAPNATRPCGNPTKGKCKAGTETCNSSGQWGTCQGEIKPTTETCNNEDDDCDGNIDNGLTRPCYSPDNPKPTTGECREGTQTCTAGNWGTCTGETKPATEICNNKDDDCDGTTDEGLVRSCYTGGVGTQGVGACSDGFQICTGGNWGTCGGEVTPKAEETCDNNIDDDCDGKIDNGCVSTFAGTGAVGYKDGPALQAEFGNISGVVSDTQGNVYVAEWYCVRKIDTQTPRQVTTLAGDCNNSGNTNGSFAQARFSTLSGIVMDTSGSLLVSDDLNNCIRKIDLTNQQVSNYALGCDPNNTFGERPGELRIAKTGALYVLRGLGKQTIDVIAPITKQASTVITVSGPTGNTIGALALDPTEKFLYFSFQSCVQKVELSTKTKTVVAGVCGTSGYMEGSVTQAKFTSIGRIFFESASIFYASEPSCIRKIDLSNNRTSLFAGDCTKSGVMNGVLSKALLEGLGDLRLLPNNNLLFLESRLFPFPGSRRIRVLTFP